LTSLRARLAVLLVAAIVAVVGLAAFVTFQTIERSQDQSLARSFAEEIAIISRLVDGSPERAREAGIAMGAPPQDYYVLAQQERRIAPALEFMELDMPVHIVALDEDQRRIAFPITPDEWAYLIYPSARISFLRPLTIYLMLVTIGAVAIALYAASRIGGPMRTLEDALSAVRPDGTLGPIDEKGPEEVRATAKALNTLSARLKTALESRMRLVAAAGHDLRTPMTRLRLRTEFLPDEEREAWLRDLDELELIADSAIRLVREEVAESTFEPVALGTLMQTLVDELDEIGHQVGLQASGDPMVTAQPLAIKRALRNLLENAATHGLRARATLAQDGNDVLIAIEDEGPGIPEDLLDRVFEPFFRVDPARRKSRPGAGLGLAIAREIIERHGGTITIRNRRAGGLRQDIVLPAA
jgi:signal transduction histidine kinase